MVLKIYCLKSVKKQKKKNNKHDDFKSLLYCYLILLTVINTCQSLDSYTIYSQNDLHTGFEKFDPWINLHIPKLNFLRTLSIKHSMSEAVSPDPRNLKWSPSDDTLVVWILLCCPFSEFQRCIPMLSNRQPEKIVARFLEIIQNPSLIQRVITECRGDIIGYKTAPWSPHENLSLIRLVHNNRKCNHVQFLLKYPMLFHPSRTASSLNAAYVRLKSKDHSSLTEQLNVFNSFVQKVHDECQNLDLLPFPSEKEVQDDPKTVLEKLISPVPVETEEPQPPNYNIETFRESANNRMTKKSFAALVTSATVKTIEKARTVFGRASPKCTPDIDLAEFNLQSISRNHCAIMLAKDLNFYIECLGNMIMVNTQLFNRGAIIQIHDCDLIDIGGVPFIFFENKEILTVLRNSLS